jgi:hypothetical protein
MVIWSAASVVTGDAASARRKLNDRLLGAFVGVPIGVTLGFLMPHNGTIRISGAACSDMTVFY